VRAIVRYPAGDGAFFVRTNTFIMPCYTALPNGSEVDGKLDGFMVNVEVPRDDYETMRFSIQVQRTLGASSRRYGGPGAPSTETMPDGRKLLNRGNDYGIDREKQRSGEVFSGLDASFQTQDGCVVESMGTIVDRTEEHLGTTDTQVVAMRRFLLDTVHAFEDGADPPGLAWDIEDNDFSDLYMVSAVIPGERDWKTYIPEVTTHALAGAR
jgi:hypothetical protein